MMTTAEKLDPKNEDLMYDLEDHYYYKYVLDQNAREYIYIDGNVEPAPTFKSSYVDLEELEDCIIEYFDGTLDYVPESCYDRLWMDSTQLIPGNPLLSILDMQTMRDCLTELDVEHRLVLKAYYGNDQVAQVQLNRFSNYQGQQELLTEAIESLGAIVHKIL